MTPLCTTPQPYPINGPPSPSDVRGVWAIEETDERQHLLLSDGHHGEGEHDFFVNGLEEAQGPRPRGVARPALIEDLLLCRGDGPLDEEPLAREFLPSMLMEEFLPNTSLLLL